PGVPDLIHHKYVVRDAGRPAPAVLTGSTNWTNDSWNREENVMVTVESGEIAADFAANFEELWDKPVVAMSGRISSPWSTLADGIQVRPYFCPGRSLKLVHAMSRSIASARKRIRICSPVITSGPILGTLAEVVEHGGVDISGVYDATQMDEVLHQWGSQGGAAWKIAAFRSIIGAVHFGAKRSTPYAKGSIHDFMHAKILVTDDYVYTCSFNLSHSGDSITGVNAPASARWRFVGDGRKHLGQRARSARPASAACGGGTRGDVRRGEARRQPAPCRAHRHRRPGRATPAGHRIRGCCGRRRLRRQR